MRKHHWLRMRGEIPIYVKTYPVRQEVNSDNRATAGLRQRLEIPGENGCK